MEWIYHDGGRKEAGYKGDVGDCVIRSICIAMNRPYSFVYDHFKLMMETQQSPRNGVSRKLYKPYIESAGWVWKSLIVFGQKGRRKRLVSEDLPMGTLIVSVADHLCTVKDGKLYDTFDSSEKGKTIVYGYFYKPD